MPGTAALWTNQTINALQAWCECVILTDLLPDETDNPILASHIWTDLVIWLPAWSSTGANSRFARDRSLALCSDSRHVALLGSFVSAIHTLAKKPWELHSIIDSCGLATALGLVEQAHHLVVCSDDPVFTSVVLRAAEDAGTEAFLFGASGSPLRKTLLGGTPVYEVRLPCLGEPIRPALSALHKALATVPQTPQPGVPTATWASWLGSLKDPQLNPSDAGGAAAKLLPELRRHRSEPRFRERIEIAHQLQAGLAVEILAPTVRNESVLARIADCADGPQLHALVELLASTEAGWTDALCAYGIRTADTKVARLLWTAVCDGFLRVDTVRACATAAEIFASGRAAHADEPSIRKERATVTAAVGRFAEAEADLSWLTEHECASLPGILLAILRAWIPALKSGERSPVPQDGPDWWFGQMDRQVANEFAGATAARAFGELWLGSTERAASLIAAAAPQPAEAAAFALIAWLNRADALAAAIWRPFNGMALPDSPPLRLNSLCARSLFESVQTGWREEFRTLEQNQPELFRRFWPSTLRCHWASVLLGQLGEHDAARLWQRRARSQEPLSRVFGDDGRLPVRSA